MPDIDVEGWYAGKDFTTDWTTAYFRGWADLLAARRHESLRVLEIGSWEGRSAILFLNYLPHCHITLRGYVRRQCRASGGARMAVERCGP
jgi:hypothetical protein